jgi:hypothetical protein
MTFRTKIISRRAFEHGGNRPYTALLYMGYREVPESVYQYATITNRYGEIKRIHAMYTASTNYYLIITE